MNFSWHELLERRQSAKPATARKFIDIQPELDFTALEPGKEATDAIRKAVRRSEARRPTTARACA